MARRKHTTRRKSSRRKSSRGGGWSLDPSKMISAGNLENVAYTGAGKDCPGGSFVRPGFISGHSGSGMPGMSGGKRGSKRSRSSKRSRGGYVPAIAPTDVPAMVSAPAVPAHKQSGGRYESNPGALLNNGSDLGMASYSTAGRIACEQGSTNSLNMRGGAIPTVNVGAADSMRLYTPTAGYGHGFETYPGTSAVGGLMLNTPYDARAYNPACTKTGGGAVTGAPYGALQMDQITGRGDFDGSKGLLPMKFGGKRRTLRKTHRKRKSLRKQRK